MSGELETTEPWRRAGFLCKPYAGNDQEDAKRFYKEFADALDLESYDKGTWTGGDVIRGDHEGGTNNPINVGNAAQRAAKTRNSEVRKKHVLALLVKHILNQPLADRLRAFRATADVEAAWNDFQTSECGGATPEPAIDEIKAKMAAATIIGEVGYTIGSITNMANWLQSTNASITDAAQRHDEHKLAALMLDKIAKANQTGISHDALVEYNQPDAGRNYLQPNAGRGRQGDPPAGARSLSEILAHFGRNWDAAINAGTIHPRPKGGRQKSAGNSTRVDGHEVFFEADAAEPTLFEYEPSTGAITKIGSRNGQTRHGAQSAATGATASCTWVPPSAGHRGA